MEEQKKFYEVLAKPELTEYKDAWIMVKHQPYLVKIPISDFDTFRKLAYDKILYRLREKSSTAKKGRPLKYHYSNKIEANKCYYQAFKEKIARLARNEPQQTSA